MNTKFLCFVGSLFLLLSTCHAADARYHIIPVPEKLTPESGEFVLSAQTTIYAPKATEVAQFFADKMTRATGLDIAVSKKKAPNNIQLLLSKKVQGDEAYELVVAPNGVTATAATTKGLFYAMQTLLQLLPPQIESETAAQGITWTAPACQIQDKPRFAYRGTLLDVCRHFFGIEQLKKQIDILSMYKINNLHLHLTEDQGWRVEIKKYPKLTEVGAWRTGEHGEKVGGFYTQEQLKDLVKYAQQRFVNIVPEFEMPGHELAAIAAYPWLCCTGQQVQPRRLWGVEPIVMCPGKETTFKFLQDVVDEMVKIFPSPLFHIGGDEAPRSMWKTCPLCQKKIQELGLKDEPNSPKEAKLQSYVVGRMEKYLNKYGKSIIGWDEILEGGNLNKTAIVMSWRGEQGGIAAANAGHRVIMTPSSAGMYVDFYQGDPLIEPQAIGGYATLSNTYSYDPIPKSVAEKGMGNYILGPQVNMWAEYLPDNDRQDYRLYPRTLALAEVGWSQKENKDFDNFANRVDADASIRLSEHRVNFHIPLPEQPEGSCDYEAFTDHTTLTFKTTRPEKMVYTLDGTQPNAQSAVYTQPLQFDQSATLKIATLLPSGIMSKTRTINVEKQMLSPATQVNGDLQKGLQLQYAKGTYYKTEELANIAAWQQKPIQEITEIRAQNLGGDYAVIASGLIRIPQDGVYFFRSNVAEVWIDGQKVVDNNALLVRHSLQGGRSMALAAGLHKIRIIFLAYIGDGYDTTWDNGKVLFRQGKDGQFQNITSDILFQKP